MGVDYTAVLMVGKEFESPGEAADFMRSHGLDVPGDDDEAMEDGLAEFLYSGSIEGLNFKLLNYYSSWDGGILGWDLNVSPPEKFAEQVGNLLQRWKTLFNEDADIVHTVKVW